MTPPDLQCTWWPDVWFGIRLTPCCIEHDLSSLDWRSSVDLGLCVASTMATAHPIAGAILGAVMALGTAVWCGLRYGLRGVRRESSGVKSRIAPTASISEEVDQRKGRLEGKNNG